MDRQLIKKFCKFHEITQLKIAKESGVTETTVSYWLNNKRNSERVKDAIKKLVNKRIKEGNIYFSVEV